MSSAKNPETLLSAMRHFDPETAYQYIESIKWPDGPVCPKCGSTNVGWIKSRQRHQCREKGCRRQFSLLTGTILESTHLGLDQWMAAVWMLINCRNGVSSCEIARTIGCKQQSAWHLLHRVRHVLQQSNTGKMHGTVEADATLIGGRFSNMPLHRRAKFENRGPRTGKSIVHAFRERESGRVQAEVVKKDNATTLRKVIKKQVAKGSRLHTDSAHSYKWAKSAGYQHESVNHSIDEYVRGDVTTNGCENFFSCLRRAAKGTYIRPSHDHLPAYVDEAVFRFNVRRASEWERFDSAMRLILGKRLTYSELTGGATR